VSKLKLNIELSLAFGHSRRMKQQAEKISKNGNDDDDDGQQE
jgi:hypothetical protein